MRSQITDSAVQLSHLSLLTVSNQLISDISCILYIHVYIYIYIHIIYHIISYDWQGGGADGAATAPPGVAVVAVEPSEAAKLASSKSLRVSVPEAISKRRRQRHASARSAWLSRLRGVEFEPTHMSQKT